MAESFFPGDSTAQPSLKKSGSWRSRAKAAAQHLLISVLVAALVAGLVFGVWYPSPIRDMVGGRELFMLVMGVDLVVGPLLTFVAFNTQKKFAHLAKDLAVIAALQLIALGFGLNTVMLARPVHINFEIDRLRVVTAADIDPASLKEAPAALQSLPLDGPIQIASVKPADPKIQLRSIDLSLAGFDMNQQPFTWAAFDTERQNALWKVATPVTAMQAKWASKPQALAKLNAAVLKLAQETGPSEAKEFKVIPILSKRVSWAALIGRHGNIKAIIDEDMF